MMNLAATWGYKNNIIIKKSVRRSDRVLQGRDPEETDLNDHDLQLQRPLGLQLPVQTRRSPFEQLHMLTQVPDIHWANHHFKHGHRSEENDHPRLQYGGHRRGRRRVPRSGSRASGRGLQVPDLHHEAALRRDRPRFRLILPINYVLELDKEEYKELVREVIAWLPFQASADIDESSLQRSKKWLSHEGEHYYNLEGSLFDVLPFIPRTSKNEAYKKDLKSIASLDNLERWFAQRIVEGNRNNQMIKFALALVDSGLDLITVQRQVHAFNRKLGAPMDEKRIENTIMVTVAKRFQKQAIA
jgi:hypothetical protein